MNRITSLGKPSTFLWLTKSRWRWWHPFCLLGENRWAALAEKCHTKCKYSTLLFVYLRLFWLFLLFPSAFKEYTSHWWMMTIIHFCFCSSKSWQTGAWMRTDWRPSDVLTEGHVTCQSVFFQCLFQFEFEVVVFFFLFVFFLFKGCQKYQIFHTFFHMIQYLHSVVSNFACMGPTFLLWYQKRSHFFLFILVLYQSLIFWYPNSRIFFRIKVPHPSHR